MHTYTRNKILEWIERYRQENDIISIPRDERLSNVNMNIQKIYKIPIILDQEYSGIRYFIHNILGLDVEIMTEKDRVDIHL